MSNNVNLFVTGSEVISGSMISTGSVILTDLTASYVAGADVDGQVALAALADTGSYVAGANVDGQVASAAAAVSASHALQADAALTALVAAAAVSASHALQADAVKEPVGTAVSASHALLADAVEEPVGTAISASHALQADNALAAAAATSASHALQADASIQADSASYIAGTGVDGIVESAATASLAQLALIAEEGSGSFTGSFEGSLDLTEAQTIPLGIPVHHARQDQGGVGANFTISLDESNVQRYAYSASIEFMLTGGSAGGFYITEFEGNGDVTLTFPSASQNVYYHDGGPAPIGSGSFIGVYGFYYNGSRYLGTTVGEFPL